MEYSALNIYDFPDAIRSLIQYYSQVNVQIHEQEYKTGKVIK